MLVEEEDLDRLARSWVNEIGFFLVKAGRRPGFFEIASDDEYREVWTISVELFIKLTQMVRDPVRDPRKP